MIGLSKYKQDIKRLAELLSGEVERLSLMGGEPLLHPEIVRLMAITRQYITKGEVTVLTNGVLLHKMDEVFWQTAAANKIKIYITPYPIKLNYDRIISLAAKHGVELEYYYAGGKEQFRKLPLDPSGKQNVPKNFRRCTYSNCQTFRDGKIYGCNMPAYICRFNDYFKQDLKVNEQDYVDIYSVTSKDEIFDFLCKPIPFCRYCDVNNSKFGVPWGLSKKAIEE